mmetsp:Transcript_35185/g.79460  ORF Transcript_35185/g.79460 Transcript_35185/m.79460 type:complete len:290 (+) Transcript_35185:54-923(+)
MQLRGLIPYVFVCSSWAAKVPANASALLQREAANEVLMLDRKNCDAWVEHFTENLYEDKPTKDQTALLLKPWIQKTFDEDSECPIASASEIKLVYYRLRSVFYNMSRNEADGSKEHTRYDAEEATLKKQVPIESRLVMLLIQASEEMRTAAGQTLAKNNAFEHEAQAGEADDGDHNWAAHHIRSVSSDEIALACMADDDAGEGKSNEAETMKGLLDYYWELSSWQQKVEQITCGKGWKCKGPTERDGDVLPQRSFVLCTSIQFTVLVLRFFNKDDVMLPEYGTKASTCT